MTTLDTVDTAGLPEDAVDIWERFVADIKVMAEAIQNIGARLDALEDATGLS
jgi:hypothetical protein